MLTVKRERPPNYDRIVKAFPAALRSGVYFSYSPYVYIPDDTRLTPAIRSHEMVHMMQQGTGPAGWWDRYLTDTKFRFEQELAAHRAEYRWWRTFKPKNQHKELSLIAARLSSDLYGNVKTHLVCHSLIQKQGPRADRG